MLIKTLYKATKRTKRFTLTSHRGALNKARRTTPNRLSHRAEQYALNTGLNLDTIFLKRLTNRGGGAIISLETHKRG